MINKQSAKLHGLNIIESKHTNKNNKSAFFIFLQQHYPHTITKDNQIDIKELANIIGMNNIESDALATLLNLDNTKDIKGYELSFVGKSFANAMYSKECDKLLKLERSYIVDLDSINLVESKEDKDHKESLYLDSLYTLDTKNYLDTRDYRESRYKDSIESKENINIDIALDSKTDNKESLESVINKKSIDNKDSKNNKESINKTDSKEILESTISTQHTPANHIIIGDNIDALKLLKSAYYEQIKMIYIDPPYNTKNEHFIYPDNFREDYKELLKDVGLLTIQRDETNNKDIEIESKELLFFKNIAQTKSHSGWLAFMLPRLKLARDLLKDDGVIFISIDDNEQANLKILCDEIFGEENFIAQISWRQFHSVKNDANNFSKNIEYILCYAKYIAKNIIKNEIFDKKDSYKLNDNDGKGPYKLDPIWAKSGTNTKHFTFKNGRIWNPPSGTFWRYSTDRIKAMEDNNEIVFNGKNPMVKRYLSRVSIGRKSSTFWDGDEVGYTLNGDKEVKELFSDNKVFNSPKPLLLLKRLITISTNKEDLILDFFAGSGTTAHAVMELNTEDNGNRKFILVQIAESIKESTSKIAYDFCKRELKSIYPVISDITIERVKRVVKRILQTSITNKYTSNSNTINNTMYLQNLSFNIYSLDSKASIKKDKEGSLFIDSSNRLHAIDRARNLALFAGKQLHTPLIEIISNSVYICEDILCVVSIIDTYTTDAILEYDNKTIYIDGYSDISLDSLLNLTINNIDKNRVHVVY